MSSLINGIVREVGEEKVFDLDGKVFKYREVLFDTGGGTQILAHLHTNNDKPVPVVGCPYEFMINVQSKRNRNDPSIFFHKIKLVYYKAIVNEPNVW